jgi:hypothetical protein
LAGKGNGVAYCLAYRLRSGIEVAEFSVILAA